MDLLANFLVDAFFIVVLAACIVSIVVVIVASTPLPDWFKQQVIYWQRQRQVQKLWKLPADPPNVQIADPPDVPRNVSVEDGITNVMVGYRRTLDRKNRYLADWITRRPPHYKYPKIHYVKLER